jgi:hypothetical protein
MTPNPRNDGPPPPAPDARDSNGRRHPHPRTSRPRRLGRRTTQPRPLLPRHRRRPRHQRVLLPRSRPPRLQGHRRTRRRPRPRRRTRHPRSSPGRRTGSHGARHITVSNGKVITSTTTRREVPLPTTGRSSRPHRPSPASAHDPRPHGLEGRLQGAAVSGEVTYQLVGVDPATCRDHARARAHLRATRRALEVFRRREDEVLMSGPAGTGKSRACLEKVHAMCLKTPKVRALAVRKTGKSLASTGPGDVPGARRRRVDQGRAREVVRRAASRSRPGTGTPTARSSRSAAWTTPRRSCPVSTTSRTSKRPPSSPPGLGSDHHPPPQRRISFQQLIADCNPSVPTHWLKARCDTRPDRHAQLLPPRQPPAVVRRAVDHRGRGVHQAKLDALTGARYQRLYEGRGSPPRA